jgi:protein ImuA
MFSAATTPGAPLSGATSLHELRTRIGRIERAERGNPRQVMPFGFPPIDSVLPGRGLALAALHEAAGAGPDVEHGAAAALLIGGILARLQGTVLWVMQQPDLFAPGLAGVGLHPDRLILVSAGKEVLPVMEEGLRLSGLTAVVGEVAGRLTLAASRRLQLAAEDGGQLAFVLRRSRRFDDPVLEEPTASVTRWRVAALPTPPPLPDSPDTPGLGPARWRLELRRCRGGEAGSWIVEACDAQGRLGLPAEFRDRPAEETLAGESLGSHGEGGRRRRAPRRGTHGRTGDRAA